MKIINNEYKPNSISANMMGAQVKVTYKNGTSEIYSFNREPDALAYGYALYMIESSASSGNYKQFNVTDLGNYKAEITLLNYDSEPATVVFEANHIGGKPAAPESPKEDVTASKPSNSITATSDTTTSDTATADTIGNSNSDNNAIATGSVMCSAAIMLLLVCACGILVFFNRKRYFK